VAAAHQHSRKIYPRGRFLRARGPGQRRSGSRARRCSGARLSVRL